MPRDGLGEFEQIVMLAIVHINHLGDDVYGVPIVDEIERRTGREVSRAAVYITLRRLEEKGLVASWMSDPTSERGGRSRRCVAVTPLGRRALADARTVLDLMWRGANPKLKTKPEGTR